MKDNVPADVSKHQAIIEALAREAAAPVDEVGAMYRIEHAKLDAVARIKTFVTVIANARVRSALRRQQSGNA
jgi:Protein of unknown function (DUF3562)